MFMAQLPQMPSRQLRRKEIDQPTLIPHIAEAKSQKYSYEVLFRSLQKLLIDTATSEYVFTDDFFGEESIFHDIFAAPINRSSALLMIHSHFSSHKSAVLIQCSWQFCHRILIRPHPAVWHLVHGLAVVYLVALTFLLFQNRDDARQFMKLLHPDLGVELPERCYGADCRLYVPENPKNKFINIYV
ncbi:CDP-diacylglycerol--serine O-phosphatidyltransferase 1 [Zea mays]|uniref:CDP-diacylglycerol--serine O-phosphatidyltransferase n=1 Tax=Zea mays TaxID=4577 RepID=A0A1D6FDW1_MAIZE|nr:CDP-diacylglycerol--serine O-phosphatidyltransferase 1 [Zea mays]